MHNNNLVVPDMFANKVVLITGSSAGIGAAAAECFAKESASLAIVGRNEDRLKDVAKRCENLGATVLTIKADISIDVGAKAIIDQTIAKFGKLDVLVNNAGMVKFGSIQDSDVLKVYDEIMNINLRAVVYITHLAIPYLKETKGNIINVSSIVSTKVVLGGLLNVYSISKAGMDQFTKTAALDLAPFGVRVNSINPGGVNTNITSMANLPKRVLEKLSDGSSTPPLGRFADAEEVGELMLYLASDKAKSITGSFFVIDNGGQL